jgi:hypothetical protein
MPTVANVVALMTFSTPEYDIAQLQEGRQLMVDRTLGQSLLVSADGIEPSTY